MMNVKWIAALIALSACNTTDNNAGDHASDPQASSAEHVVYLVRHGEKQKGDDPSLSPEGKARAGLLAEIMADKGLTHIHSTNYKRTLETAAPTASLTGIDIELYDPFDLTAFAKDLQASEGVHLVVGHSNTTPQLALALGGEPGSDIDEQDEYDRLYVVQLRAGETSSTIERYGVRYKKD